jgi:hypothetical protein
MIHQDTPRAIHSTTRVALTCASLSLSLFGLAYYEGRANSNIHHVEHHNYYERNARRQLYNPDTMSVTLTAF